MSKVDITFFGPVSWSGIDSNNSAYSCTLQSEENSNTLTLNAAFSLPTEAEQQDLLNTQLNYYSLVCKDPFNQTIFFLDLGAVEATTPPFVTQSTCVITNGSSTHLGQGSFFLSANTTSLQVQATINLSALLYLPAYPTTLVLQAAEDAGNEFILYSHTIQTNPTFNFSYASYYADGSAFAGSTSSYNSGQMDANALTFSFALPPNTNLSETKGSPSGQIDMQLSLPNNSPLTQTIAIVNGVPSALNPLNIFYSHKASLSYGYEATHQIPYLTISSPSNLKTLPLANITASLTIYS